MAEAEAVLKRFTHACRFTNDVTGFLTGGQIPQDVIGRSVAHILKPGLELIAYSPTDLPKEFLSTPFGASLKPMIDNMFRGAMGQPEHPPSELSEALANHPGLISSMEQIVQAAQATSPQGESNGSAQSGGGSLSSRLTIITNIASFRSTLSSNKCVVVMFTGEWCGPCKVIKPVFQDLAHRGPEERPVAFAMVDTSAGREVAQAYSVSAVPTFMFFLKGEKVCR